MQHKDKLEHYLDLLLQWQKTINLVSPSTLADAWDRHFEDSLQLLKYIPNNVKTICDIGSGAGFPGLVLAIERPDIAFHIVESDTRKCAFLRTVSRETSCQNVAIHNGRIENTIDDIHADMVTCRALASLKKLIIYTKSQWDNNIDFTLLSPKGANFNDEIIDAEKLFSFDLSDYPSVTNDQARILIVGNIIEK
jgi:16S rRNA (guanine527-N7)-methyltransferase